MRKKNLDLLLLVGVGVGAYLLFKKSSMPAASNYYGTGAGTGTGQVIGQGANFLQSIFRQFGPNSGGGSPAFMPINYTGSPVTVTGTGTAVA